MVFISSLPSSTKKHQSWTHSDKPLWIRACASFSTKTYEISNNVVCATRKGSDQRAHTRSLIRAFAMNIKLLTEHYLEFLSLKGGCTGSLEITTKWVFAERSVGNKYPLFLRMKCEDSNQTAQPQCWFPRVATRMLRVLKSTVSITKKSWYIFL